MSISQHRTRTFSHVMPPDQDHNKRWGSGCEPQVSASRACYSLDTMKSSVTILVPWSCCVPAQITKPGSDGHSYNTVLLPPPASPWPPVGFCPLLCSGLWKLSRHAWHPVWLWEAHPPMAEQRGAQVTFCSYSQLVYRAVLANTDPPVSLPHSGPTNPQVTRRTPTQSR